MTHTTVYAARKILTMNPRQPHATHIAVRDGRVLAVGDLKRMQAWGEFDLDERFADKVLMPGLIEGHCHLKEGSVWDQPYLGWFERRDPQGRAWPGLSSMDAVVARLIELDAQMTAAGKGDEVPLLCWGFDPIYFGGERMTVEHLDRASGKRPIVVAHSNGHVMNVNSVLLRLAGITRETEVDGVMKFANGEANGELQEPAAMFPVVRKVGQRRIAGADERCRHAQLCAHCHDAGCDHRHRPGEPTRCG